VDAGIDPVRINRMLGFIYRGDKKGDKLYLPNGALKFQNIHGILIVKDGWLVFGEYFYLNDEGDPFQLMDRSILPAVLE
jgi:hypothetical protein